MNNTYKANNWCSCVFFGINVLMVYTYFPQTFPLPTHKIVKLGLRKFGCPLPPTDTNEWF